MESVFTLVCKGHESMEKETSSAPKTRSNRKIWLIVTIVVGCLLLACCLAIVVGILLLRPVSRNKTVAPEVQTVSTLSSVPNVPLILDYEIDPVFGSTSLQRGFSPDPYVAGMGAGGTFDSSQNNLACGFTTNAPTFTFNLSGGASEGFLRIYFVPSDTGQKATLILHTPDQSWMCADNPSTNNGTNPSIDIQYATSGKYAVWVGLHQGNVFAPGMLYITEAASNTP
jgi:hypothetical protein